MAIIRCEGLGKTFRIADKQPGLAGTLRHLLKRRTRAVEAVKQVSFTVEPGEMVGFLGPNGAGKTTTLKMLSRLLHPSAGRAEVAGFVAQRRLDRRLAQGPGAAGAGAGPRGGGRAGRCERCWHYEDDIGSHTEPRTL